MRVGEANCLKPSDATILICLVEDVISHEIQERRCKEWERDSGREANVLRLRIAPVFVMRTLMPFVIGCEVGKFGSTQSGNLTAITLTTNPHDAAGLNVGCGRVNHERVESVESESLGWGLIHPITKVDSG